MSFYKKKKTEHEMIIGYAPGTTCSDLMKRVEAQANRMSSFGSISNDTTTTNAALQMFVSDWAYMARLSERRESSKSSHNGVGHQL